MFKCKAFSLFLPRNMAVRQKLYSNPFFNNSNVSNIEYYNTWYGRKTTFNPMFFQYLKDKLIDSYITSLTQKFSLTVFEKILFTIELVNFTVNQQTVCQCLLFCLSDIVIMLKKKLDNNHWSLWKTWRFHL